MSLRPVVFSLGLSLFSLGCESKTPEAEASPTTTVSSATTPPATKKLGAPLTLKSTTQLKELLTSPDDFAGKTVLVEGTVTRACSKKGCWMELSTAPHSPAGAASPPGAACRVTFKDYGFFVPLDAAGSHARVEGELEVKEVTAAHVNHLEAEGASIAGKQADGSAREVRFVATGVELTRG